MTKRELEQYRSIVAEIDELRDRINNNTVSDTVTGSDREFPYTAHVMGIGGVEESGTFQKDMALLRRLEKQRKAVEDFVDAIDDSLTRRVFRCRYIDGSVKPSWQWIAFKIGHYDEQFPRRLHNQYLKKQNLTKMTKNKC